MTRLIIKAIKYDMKNGVKPEFILEHVKFLLGLVSDWEKLIENKTNIYESKN